MSDAYPKRIIDGDGLYGGGSNTRPSSHEAAGIKAGALVPAKDAVIAAVSMSNGSLEFDAFKLRATWFTDARFVNCACWGCTVRAWSGPLERGWKTARNKIAQAGIASGDVSVVWLKQANKAYEAVKHADLEVVLGCIKAEWPNVKQVFVSDRIYCGWIANLPPKFAATGAEPMGGWNAGPEVRKFVLAHLGQSTPFIDWGPYLWGNATEWPRSLFEADGTHVTAVGAAKIGQQLFDFFTNNPATSWFRN